MKNRKLIYWKWDEKVFEEGELERQLDEFLSRCDFDTVYLKYNVIEISYKDERLNNLLTMTANRLKGKGIELILDVDLRDEQEFLIKNPDSTTKYLKFIDGDLDENGQAVIFVENENNSKFTLINGYTFEKIDTCTFSNGTLTTCQVFERAETNGTTFYVNSTNKLNSNHFLLAVIADLGKVDVFAPEVNDYYVEMIKYFSTLPITSCSNDEWRAILPLKYDESTENFYSDGLMLSDAFCKSYFNEYGVDLLSELPYLAYIEQDNEEKSRVLIAQYSKLIRKTLKTTNDLFFDTVKKYFGKDAFVGVHPTYWGDPYFCYFDVLCNGFNWWEVKRDYAQTDEFCLYPIRLALSRKAKDNVWYNMWYGGGTLQLHTYYEEAWRNLKYHGKVHYLGWKCSKETNVYALSTPKSIENVCKMENTIEDAFSHVKSVPNSSVLVVFGMESYCDWIEQFKGTKILRGEGYGVDIFECTQGIFNAYNCDMVPSSEIDNGSVRFEGEKVFYGNQEYKAIVCLKPNGVSQIVNDCLSNYAKFGNLIVCGATTNDIANAKYYFDSVSDFKQIIIALQSMQIPTHRVAGGVEYRDGTLVFTANATLPTGNYFEVNFNYNGVNYDFKGYDYLIIDANKNIYYGEGSSIIINKE